MLTYAWMGEIHNYDLKVLDDKFKFLREKNFTGVIFRSDNKDFSKVVELANKNNLLIEAWYPVLTCLNKDSSTIDKNLFAVNKKGESSLVNPPYVDYYKWLCPNRDEVYQLIISDLDKILNYRNLDSVHMDYIRYCDVKLPKGLWKKYNLIMDRDFPEYDFCYCPTCRSLFKSKEGIDPIDIEYGSQDEKLWRDFRLNSITSLVVKIRDYVHSKGKKISSAVFPGPSIAITNVLQEWSKWNLDRYYPMNYNLFYEKDSNWIEEMVDEEVRDSKGSEIFSGLYLHDLSPEEFKKSITYSLNSGAKGIGIFVPEDMEEEHWKVFDTFNK